MKTNLQMLIDGVEKARNEKMTIFENGDPINPGFIAVNGTKGYVIKVINNEIQSCSCPHHYHRGVICKHMIKVSLEKNMDIVQLGRKEESVKEAI